MPYTVAEYRVEDGLRFHPFVRESEVSTYGAALLLADQIEVASISKMSGKKTIYCAVVKER